MRSWAQPLARFKFRCISAQKREVPACDSSGCLVFVDHRDFLWAQGRGQGATLLASTLSEAERANVARHLIWKPSRRET
jgi:hypothetical protein